MEKVAQKELNIDKSNWIPVSFGDVVFEPKESVKDIANSNISHIVGLEHLDSESIHLKRSAGIEESTTFTKKFSVGDVLFGRRRAYLKKAAQATFDGICSGDITVFRAKDNLLPELLPFIVQNDKFFDYAVKHSAGGLSPRVKFKDLVNYEFHLPPKEQQAEIAELLWAMDDVIEKEIISLNYLLSLEKILLIKDLLGVNVNELKVQSPLGILPQSYRVLKVDDIIIKKKGAMKMGPFGSSLKRNTFVACGYKVYGQENVYKKDMSIGDRFISDNHFNKLKSCEIFPGDFLITMMGTIGESMIVPKNIQKGIMDSHLVRLQIDRNIVNPIFIGLQFKTSLILNQINKLAVGGIMAGLSSSIIKKIHFIIPPMEIQENIIKKYVIFQNTIINHEDNLDSSKKLQKSLINKVF